MTIREIHRDECPEPWFLGCQVRFGKEVLELIEIEGDKYTWIDVETADEKRLIHNGA